MRPSTHCRAGHMRTPENSTTDGRCKTCRTASRAALYARQSQRPKHPVKVRAGLAGQAAKRARLAREQRVAASVPSMPQVSPDAIRDEITRLAAQLTPSQRYQLEKAVRIAAGKPVLRTLEERRRAELNRVQENAPLKSGAA